VSGESAYKAQFSELMEVYAGPIRRLCAAYALSVPDREDLFQEIFLAVWRALPAFRGESSSRTWLYRIAHNVALTWQTRDRRRHSRETRLAGDVGVSTDMTRIRGMDVPRLVPAGAARTGGRPVSIAQDRSPALP
jgi:RNA polymerase sigma-70 factor (ECF subfamily)